LFLRSVLLVFSSWLAIAPATSSAGVVINEIFYNAPNDLDDLQWIEFQNASAQANYGFLHTKSDYWLGNFDFSVPTPATASVTFDDYFMMNQAFLKKATHGGPIPMAKVVSPFSKTAVAAPSAARAAVAPRKTGKRLHHHHSGR
jgi:hypothetical protein